MDRYDPSQNRWTPIALTIALPLTKASATRIQAGNLRIIDLDSHDIASQSSPIYAILLDTWIVHKTGVRKGKVIRERHNHYAACLLFLHIGIYGNGEGNARIFVEADNKAVFGLCGKMGFKFSNTTKKGAKLQVMLYPDAQLEDVKRGRQNLIVRNIKKLR